MQSLSINLFCANVKYKIETTAMLVLKNVIHRGKLKNNPEVYKIKSIKLQYTIKILTILSLNGQLSLDTLRLTN